MNSCLTVLIVLIVCGTLLSALFFVLLAMPKSQFRSVVLEMFGWFSSLLSGVLLVSPVDIIPDPLIGIGQVDDIGYILVGIAAAIFAYFQRQSRNRQLSDGDD